jgi:hypothetical protein
LFLGGYGGLALNLERFQLEKHFQRLPDFRSYTIFFAQNKSFRKDFILWVIFKRLLAAFHALERSDWLKLFWKAAAVVIKNFEHLFLNHKNRKL